MLACGSGQADCVIKLCNHGADMHRKSRGNRGQGLLQLARQAQGNNAKLANWLLEHVDGIQETFAQGRAWHQKSTGNFSKYQRSLAGPRHQPKGSGKGGYAPQQRMENYSGKRKSSASQSSWGQRGR